MSPRVPASPQSKIPPILSLIPTETFTYPLNLFTSSSEFTLSAESFNHARSVTSDAIQSQIDAYVNSLPSDNLWLRNIYLNPYTSRGLANLHAAGKSETEIEELKTHYRSTGTNAENGKEAWVWKDQLLLSAPGASKKDLAQQKIKSCTNDK